MKRKRAGVPGCNTILFGDLRTATVLYAAAAPGLRQENHDKLLADARTCIVEIGRTASSRFFGTDVEIHDAVQGTNTRLTYFKSNPSEGDEVYCASAELTSDLSAMKAAIDGLFDRKIA